MKLEDRIRGLISDKLCDVGITLDDVIYVYEDGNYFLRIVIDKNGVVDIDTCVEATKIINPILDEANLIDEAYILDVTSKERGEV